ncbi:MAG: hypothetical protein EPO02_12725 [Nitrospirae bacterium]|nr:MAG: hypothetical protein EPO02_12725 [Nitrospirota bacterium]
MIVEDHKKTIEHAHLITNKLASIINKEAKNFIHYDAAEHIYLLLNVSANFLARICLTLKNYGKETHGFDELTIDKILEVINLRTLENIKINEDNV